MTLAIVPRFESHPQDGLLFRVSSISRCCITVRFIIVLLWVQDNKNYSHKHRVKQELEWFIRCSVYITGGSTDESQIDYRQSKLFFSTSVCLNSSGTHKSSFSQSNWVIKLYRLTPFHLEILR